MNNIKSTFIRDKQVFAVSDKDTFVKEIIREKKILIAMNSKKVVLDDPKYTEIVNKNIAYPDGMPVAKVLNRKGLKSIKYAGHKMWLDIIDKTYQDKSFYIIGATSEVVNDVVEKLKTNYQNINIVNFRDGYLTESDISILKKDLQEKKPDIVFVAMGFPKQDYFMQDLYDGYPALYMGLGGSFNVFTNRASLVPDWWEKYIKSEGLYRVLQDPKKLSRQKYTLKFLYYYYLNKL